MLTISLYYFQLNASDNKWPIAREKYLDVSGRPEIWNCKFVKGDKITSAGGYADGEIYFCCNSHNLTTKTVTVQLWETEGIDEQIQKEAKVKVTDTGIIKIKLDYGQIKKVHKGKWSSGPLTIHALVTEPYNKIKISTHKIEHRAQYVLAQNYDKINPGKTPAPVHTGEKGSSDKICLCEQYSLIWGGLVSCEFRKKVVQICEELWGAEKKIEMANSLMACMALETNKTFNPQDSNKNGYFGLIGFGNDGVKDIGTTREVIMSMNAVGQLDWVKLRLDYIQKRLMNNQKGGILSDFTDLYLAIIYPTKSGLLTGEDPKNKIIFDASIDKKHMLEYRQNPSFMKEKGEYEHKQDVTFKRRKNGELVAITESERGYDEKEIEKAKTYRWEITQEIQNWYDNGKGHSNVENKTCSAKTISKPALSFEKGTWNIIIIEKYTGGMCEHELNKKRRNNCRRGLINVYDQNKKIVLTIDDCLLEGVAGSNHFVTSADVPYGIYQIQKKPTPFNSGGKRASYGPNPRLAFEPIKGSGDEADQSGRSEIRIHGGRQEDSNNKPLKNPELKRTEGCIRIYDAEAKRLYDWWQEFSKNNPNITPGTLTIEK